MKRVIPILLASCAPAMADTDYCARYAAVAYDGSEDGRAMESIIDGIEEILIRMDTQNEIEARFAAGSYLAGYSSGLMLGNSLDAANEFMAACIEGAK